VREREQTEQTETERQRQRQDRDETETETETYISYEQRDKKRRGAERMEEKKTESGTGQSPVHHLGTEKVLNPAKRRYQ
jgi:hypothetical protein